MQEMAKKRILVYRWNSYNDLDVEQTFRLLGYEVDSVERDKKTYDRDPEFEQRIKNKIAENTYDFFFTMNYFPAISIVCEACGIRYVSWTCDSPLIAMYDKAVFLDCNIIFTFDRSNYLEFKARGVKHIYHMPLAVNTARIAALPGFFEKRFEHEISFVGSLYTERNTYDRIKEQFPEYLRGYLDATMQARLTVPDNQMLEAMLTTDILETLEENYHLEKSEGSFSNMGLIFSTTVLGFKMASIQRRRALVALSKKHEVTLYNKEKKGELFSLEHKDAVDYWRQMPLVFRRSKINLNFTIPNIATGLPLRIWDVLGSGGFLLTNFQQEIPEFFEDGKDLVCFHNEEDMCKKADYYLTHDKEREEIAAHGRKKAMQHHTYYERMKKMIDIIDKT